MSERKRLTRQVMSERPTFDVDILDGFVTIRKPNVEEVLAMKQMAIANDELGTTAKMIMACVVEEDGSPTFTDEAQIRRELSPEAYDALSRACVKLFRPQEPESITKNSPASQSTDLVSA